ncbi:MAG: energy transducer TonB [Planctomycetota bacterium]
MSFRRPRSLAVRLLQSGLVLVAGVVLTVGAFMLLPLIQAITKAERPDTLLTSVDTAAPPPPPPPVEEEPPEEEEEEEPEPPEMENEPEPDLLAALELSLNPGFGNGTGPGIGNFKLGAQGKGAGGDDDKALFSLAELDQKPRAVYQPSPSVEPALKKKAPATVYVLFIVNESGKVEKPKAKRSSDPAFESAAVSAVKKWKFEPGKRNGKPVRFRMLVPITFPKG